MPGDAERSKPLAASPGAIKQAAALLREGKLVAFPTETVYGLGGDATNDKAVAAIYAAKGRPQFNPLIVHVAEVSALDNFIEWNETAKCLAAAFWPGPLTLVLPRKAGCNISLLVSAGMDSLAVRIPSHPVAQKLIKEIGRPVAAPSANLSGKLSPTAPEHVAEALSGKVDLILDGGNSTVGLESTVVDLFSKLPRILRHGGITREQIEAVIGPISMSGDESQPLSPGQLPSHYAPNLPLRLNTMQATGSEAFLTFGDDKNASGGAVRLNLSAKGDLTEAAANLFAMLRKLDDKNYSGIAVMPVPKTGVGAAINDRLNRASVR